MDTARMITKRIAIDGEWFTIQVFKEEDGLRMEMVHDIKGKFYKMYPDNKIKMEDFSYVVYPR